MTPSRLAPSVSSLVLALALAPGLPAQNHVVNFTTLGTFTTPSLDIGLLQLTADDGAAPALVNVLNFNGLGVVGGPSSSMCDATEALHFTFASPVVDVRYAVFVANNGDADGKVGEAFLEAFSGAMSLGVVAVHDTGFKQVSQLFGGVPITSFTVRADNEGQRIDVLHYQEDPWTDLGSGLAGSLGVPQLSATGPLEAGSALTVSASGLAPDSLAVCVVGLAALNAPFKGGVLVPRPDLLVAGLATGALGALNLSGTFPAGVPSGTQMWLQVWLADPAGVAGFAASNALLGTTP